MTFSRCKDSANRMQRARSMLRCSLFSLFSMQSYGESLGYENENSYNEGAKFLKQRRGFPPDKITRLAIGRI